MAGLTGRTAATGFPSGLQLWAVLIGAIRAKTQDAAVAPMAAKSP